MKKYFISSDIHSFFDEWQLAITKKGFDIANKDHIIVICGDIFDRGNKPLEVYNFLKSLPKERRILIRGNHEILLREMCERGYSENHDRHNGTNDTVFKLAGYESEKEFTHGMYRERAKRNLEYGTQAFENFRTLWHNKEKQVFKGKLITEILDWIYSDEWVNYWETNNYIFVHSWIPVQEHYDFAKSMAYGFPVKTSVDSYREDWRNATQTEWDDAMWPCPWKRAKAGFNKTGKTLVVGHWHTSDFYNNLTKQQKRDVYDCPIFKSKRYKLIGLDACTAGSFKVNCLVLTEEEL